MSKLNSTNNKQINRISFKGNVNESRKRLRSALSKLTSGQKSIVELRYLSEKVHSIDSLATKLQHSKEELAQFEAQALRMLMCGKAS